MLKAMFLSASFLRGRPEQQPEDANKKKMSFPVGLLILVGLVGIFRHASAPIVTAGPVSSGDVAWMLAATGLVLLITPRLSFFYDGMVTTTNVNSTMLKSIIALGIISHLWVTDQ